MTRIKGLSWSESQIGNKYGAIRTYVEMIGRTFDSKAEASRARELALLERAGRITDLEYQVSFVLYEKPRVSITIDFRYLDGEKSVLEDVKGVLTRDFRTKLAWLEEKYGLEVRLVK
jgi:hypothetical protein